MAIGTNGEALNIDQARQTLKEIYQQPRLRVRRRQPVREPDGQRPRPADPR